MFRRPKTAHLSESQVWMTLADYEAQQIAMEQLTAENDALREVDRQHVLRADGLRAKIAEAAIEEAELAERVDDEIADLRRQIESARNWHDDADAKAQDLERANEVLRGRVLDLDAALARHGLNVPLPQVAGQESLPGTDEA